MCKQKNHKLPAALVSFCQGHLGDIAGFEPRVQEHAKSQVWEVWSRRGKRAFLKRHSQPRKFEQERYAFDHWLKDFEDVPSLLAVQEQAQALLLSAVPGEMVEMAAFSQDWLELYHQAGRFLRRLHSLPFVDADPLPLHEALLKRARTWAERARGIMAEQDISWVLDQVTEAASYLVNVKRVPCHRDYTPRNWLTHQRKLYVIDFEHSRPDWWLVDIEKLWSLTAYEHPERMEAFLQGYGHLAFHERPIKLYAALNALSTIVWAREHRDKDFEATGWHLLRRVKQLLDSH